MKFVLIGFLLIFLCGHTSVVFADYSATLGPEQLVMEEPSGSLYEFFPDGHLTVYKINEGKSSERVYGILPETKTNFRVIDPYAPIPWTTANLEVMGGLTNGPTGTFDGLGAWLQAVYVEPGTSLVHGFYAGEPMSNITGNGYKYLHASVAYTFSADGGKTWTKPNYPNNEVITSPDDVVEGDLGNVMKVNVDGVDYLYMFLSRYDYNTPNSGWAMMARAKLSDIGKPDGWKKYYCSLSGVCGFTEPGLLGKSSQVPGLTCKATVSHNSYLNEIIGGGCNTLGKESSGQVPLRLIKARNGNLLKWDNLFLNPPSMSQPQSGYEFYYSSLVPTVSGEMQITGQTFWHYYVRRPDGSGKNRLLRRLVTLSGATASKDGDADGDGQVDNDDFLIWRANYGQDGGVDKGNFNSDTYVDGKDYAIWYSNFSE